MLKGTGKSFLIETITQKLNSLYQDFNRPTSWVVAVLAPTGLAAYNVNGTTIHRFFKLPVFKTKNAEHFDLSDQDCKTIRELLPALDLIIIGKCHIFFNASALFLKMVNNHNYFLNRRNQYGQ